jgi:mannose-6-phosphate isomerase-like protein (cupin superfamily)
MRPAHYVSGDLYTTLAAARETRNQFAVVDFFVPPGGGPFPHAHDHEWETFFVIEGTVNFYVDVNPMPPFNVLEQAAGPGTTVYAPKCRVMGFINRSAAPARILAFAVPAGIDNFFHLVGDEVVDYYAPIPPPTPEQFMRLAFWGDREAQGDTYFPGGPPPSCPGVPEKVMTSITDPARPTEIGPFGETRRVLVTPTEVGNLTGASAFCGFGPPGRPGGTAKSSYFTLATGNGAVYSSPNTELFYPLRGWLTFIFENNRRVVVGPKTYVEIQPGVPFTIEASNKGVPAEALTMSVIAPACPPPF